MQTVSTAVATESHELNIKVTFRLLGCSEWNQGSSSDNVLGVCYCMPVTREDCCV